MRLYRCNGGTTAYRPRSLGITCGDWSRCSSQHHSPSDWIGGGTSTSIVVAQERAPCAVAMEGGLRPGLRPPVSDSRHPGPVDNGSGTRGGGSGDWPPEPTNAAASRCDLTTLVPMGRGSGGRREWRKGTGGARGLQWRALHRSELHRRRQNRRRATVAGWHHWPPTLPWRRRCEKGRWRQRRRWRLER